MRVWSDCPPSTLHGLMNIDLDWTYEMNGTKCGILYIILDIVPLK